MSTTKQYPDFNGLTFEKVWAALMENREQQKETDRLLKETALQMKEIERKREEEHDHEYKELRAQLGRLGNRLGEFMEYTVRPALDKKFNELGYHFDGTSTNQKIKDPLTGNTLTELDVILENDDSIIVVEAKVNPSEEDVNHFSYLECFRSFRLRKYPGDQQWTFGALAGVVFPDTVQKAALSQGYYAIVPSGESIKIVVPEQVGLKAF